MSTKHLERELGVSRYRGLSALQFAAALVGSTALVDDYPADFAEQLAGLSPNGEQGRRPAAWIEECQPFVSGQPSPEKLFFALVFASDSFAAEFLRWRPSGAAFERRCRAFTDVLDHPQKERWDRLVGVAPTPSDRVRLQAMAKAADCREAEFTQLVEARCYQQPGFHDVERERLSYRRFYPLILDAFENKHGRITEEYWGSQVPTGLVRTAGGDRIHFEGNFPDLAETIVIRCAGLRQKAEEYLTVKEYEYVISDLYRLLSNLYEEVDLAAAAGRPFDTGKAEELMARVGAIDADVEGRMARRGQRWYVGGTFLGLSALTVVMTPLIAINLGDWEQLFIGAIFGAAGAIGSVLFRMGRRMLPVDASQGAKLVYVAALVRPLTGALFGAIVSAIALSSLLPIEIPAADPKRFYFLGVLSFIAGFSERWAPDLLAATAQQIVPAREKDEQDEPKGTGRALKRLLSGE